MLREEAAIAGASIKSASLSFQLGDFIPRNAKYVAMVLGGVLLLTLGGFLGWQSFQGYENARRLDRANAIADQLLEVSAVQARERGLTALLLGHGDDPAIGRQLDELRAEADRLWNQTLGDIREFAPELAAPAFVNTYRELVDRAQADVQSMRVVADQLRESRAQGSDIDREAFMYRWFEQATELIENTRLLRNQVVLAVDTPPEVTQLNFSMKNAVWETAESVGRLRGLLAYYIASDSPVPDDRLGTVESAFESGGRSVEHLLRMHQLTASDSGLGGAIQRVEENYTEGSAPRLLRGEDLTRMLQTGDYPYEAPEWFAAMSRFIEDVLHVSSVASQIAGSRVEALARTRMWAMGGYAGLSLLAGVLAAVSLLRIRRDAEAYFHQREIADITLNAVGDAVITTDGEGRLEYINPFARELTGWSLEEAWGLPVQKVFNVINRENESMADPVNKCLEDEAMVGLTSGHTLITRNGQEIPVDDSVTPIRDREGEIIGAVVVFYDMREADRQNHLLSYHASRDMLTGLVNRREFERQLDQLIERAHVEGEDHVLAYLDLDHFKLVNDTCGHNAGDRLLRQVASLFDQQVRDTDTLARLGGDEFALLLRRCNLNQASQVARKLLRAVRDFHFTDGNQVFEIGASIGMAAITAQTASAAEVLSEADAACYAAKADGRNGFHIYQPDDLDLARRKGDLYWINRIQEALRNDDFELHCQRIKPLRPDLVEHAEVLVRMLDHDGSHVTPGTFITAAERYTLMPGIDHWVIRQTFKMISHVMHEESETIFNVNISGSTLVANGVGDVIRSGSLEYGIPPERLCFEITESAAIANLQEAVQLISELESEGYRFALDDFGSGISSYEYLKTLPVHMVKIDGMFVRQLENSTFNAEMVRSTARIARVLGIRVCAEYVEDESLIQVLRDMGIDYVQGYGIHAPEPLAEFIRARC